jgi:hypothetical protein
VGTNRKKELRRFQGLRHAQLPHPETCGKFQLLAALLNSKLLAQADTHPQHKKQP